ncbi:hypothetical protein [Bosea sp. TAB14]
MAESVDDALVEEDVIGSDELLDHLLRWGDGGVGRIGDVDRDWMMMFAMI